MEKYEYESGLRQCSTEEHTGIFYWIRCKVLLCCSIEGLTAFSFATCWRRNEFKAHKTL